MEAFREAYVLLIDTATFDDARCFLDLCGRSVEPRRDRVAW